MKRILEITTRIGCSNMCEYCPQAKLIKNYTDNIHNHRIEKRFKEHDDIMSLQKLLVGEYLKSDKNRETEMSMDTFVKCLSTIPTDVDIHFTGYTEAFENPMCLRMVKHAFKKGHRVLINTTIVGLKKSDVDELEKLQFKDINFHLPSATFKENIGRNSRLLKIKTGKEISEDYHDMIEYILKSKLPHHFHAHGGIHPEIVERFGKRLPAKNRGLNSRAGNLGKMTGEALWEKNWCQRIYHNVLLPDGTVQLCCQDYGLDEPLGNLKYMPYGEIHSTNKFKNITEGGAGLCQACDDGIAVPREMMVKLRSMQDHQDEWRVKKNK